MHYFAPLLTSKCERSARKSAAAVMAAVETRRRIFLPVRRTAARERNGPARPRDKITCKNDMLTKSYGGCEPKVW